MAKDTTAEDILLPEDERVEEAEVETGDRGDDIIAKEDSDELPPVEGAEEEAEAEPEAEEAEGEEAEGEEEAPAEPEAEKNNAMIPKHRYDSAKERAREAERRLAEYEAKQKQPEATEADAPEDDYEAQLVALDTKHAKSLADGEYEEAAKFAQQARGIERQMYRAEAEAMARQSSTATREEMRLDAAVDALYVQYPSLDPDGGTFDQDKTDEVLRLQGAFASAGSTPTEALYEAVRYALGTAPVEAEAPAPKAEVEKRKTDLKKNVDTDKAQPPSLDKVGDNNGKHGVTEALPDPMQMTEDEFNALPESTLRKMRGDVD